MDIMENATVTKRGEYRIKEDNLHSLNLFLKKVEKTKDKNESNN